MKHCFRLEPTTLKMRAWTFTLVILLRSFCCENIGNEQCLVVFQVNVNPQGANRSRGLRSKNLTLLPRVGSCCVLCDHRAYYISDKSLQPVRVYYALPIQGVC